MNPTEVKQIDKAKQELRRQSDYLFDLMLRQSNEVTEAVVQMEIRFGIPGRDMTEILRAMFASGYALGYIQTADSFEKESEEQ